jgi:hypothetical protein
MKKLKLRRIGCLLVLVTAAVVLGWQSAAHTAGHAVIWQGARSVFHAVVGGR